MNGKRNLLFLIASLVILAVLTSCAMVEKPDEAEPTETAEIKFPLEELVIEGPEGTEIFIGPSSLSKEVEVKVEDLGEGTPFDTKSPFNAASAEYYVDLGDADQIGEMTMTVPLFGVTKLSAPASSDLAYLTWTEPEEGSPSVVGTIVENNQATFPLVGAGKYQVFSLQSHAALLELVSIFDPLAVPTYPQKTPAWCSPTAMTNLAQYHQGAWPAGGLGSAWGESSNWYLAGNAGQAHEEGRFFHQVLGAGGYTVPEDVKQSFSDANAEVIIWNWKALVASGYTNPTFANILFNSFQSYVESYLWGIWGDRRPVAWGSSLAGHSRTITGSDGSFIYFNNPSSGSLNAAWAWEDYRQAVVDSLTAEKIEVIDTVVFHALPRPAAERRGVIWLLPRADNGFPGSVALIAGDTGLSATNWHWDGSMSHVNGYYHQDLRGILPTDPVFDSQFKATHYADRVEFGFGVKNITGRDYDFTLNVALYNEDMSVLKTVGVTDMTVPAGKSLNFLPANSFSILNIPQGLYTMKFHLSQNGIFQDVKYVQFRLEETDLLTIDPHGILVKRAYCRIGPSTEYPGEMIYNEGTAVRLLGVNPERTWGKFEKEVDEILFQCWISFAVVDVTKGEEVPVLSWEPLQAPEPGTGKSCSAYKTEESCLADSDCTWVFGLGPEYCTSK
ncbi:MAG: hypothetical protein GQ562_10580 [Anaerolineales bacterium]|nr:hypothetical protein [Anaerolineales bacterium]